MSDGFLQYPLTGYRQPAVTQALLEDCALDTVLLPYLKNPVAYLTCDAQAIAERNGILRELLDNSKVYIAFEALAAKLDELLNIIRQKDIDPMLVLSGISVLPETHKILLDACDILRAGEYPPASPFHMLLCMLSLAVEKCFSKRLQDTWAKYASEPAAAVLYLVRFNDEARVQDISLIAKQAMPFRRGLLKRDKTHRWLGGVAPLQADHRSSPGYSYDPGGSLNLLQQCKISLNRLLAVQAAEGKRRMTEVARQLLQLLRPIHGQLKFFICAASIVRFWGEGAYCFPEICADDDAVFCANRLVHPIGIGKHIENDLALNADSSIALLAGMNRGGKTTFLRAALAVQVLFQMGLPVPAASARLSPASGIVSVFARRENADLGFSKLAKELTDLHSAITGFGPRGFFAFNEPITATSVAECLYLSREMMCIVKALNARGIWVTHLYGLYDGLEAINQKLPGGSVFPIRTTSADDNLPQFSIVAGRPAGESGARMLLESLKGVNESCCVPLVKDILKGMDSRIYSESYDYLCFVTLDD